MKFGVLFFFITAATWLTGCSSADEKVSAYFSKQEADTLLTNMVTYMHAYAPGASNEIRFDPKYRPFYQIQAGKYTIENYYITPDSTHYFFVSRPVGNGQLYQRGIGGRFRLKAGSLMPWQFEEMWCTPHFKEATVIQERGKYIFKEMVAKGNVDHLLEMKHYIEWPDATLVYDTGIQEWVSRK